jgi:hypothetical protein
MVNGSLALAAYRGNRLQTGNLILQDWAPFISTMFTEPNATWALLPYIEGELTFHRVEEMTIESLLGIHLAGTIELLGTRERVIRPMLCLNHCVCYYMLWGKDVDC